MGWLSKLKKRTMSPTDIQNEYLTLCARLGDLEITIDRMQADRNTVKQQIAQLQKRYNRARAYQKNTPQPKAPETAPPPTEATAPEAQAEPSKPAA